MVAEMVGAALMLQGLIRGMLLVEVLCYVWLARQLAQGGTPYQQIAALIVAIALLWRLTHALGSYLIAALLRWRDKRSLPLGNSLAALWSELRARIVSYNWSQAFPGLALGPDPVGNNVGTPILLVHGFFSNRGMWVRFRQRLAAANLGPIYTVTLEPLAGPIDALVAPFEDRLAEIARETGRQKFIIIAHSMGGLVVRAHMAQSGTANIGRLITLGSPHHGTKMAGLGLMKCAGQMKYQSRWIETLSDMEAANPPNVPTMSIYTLNDDLVYPPESSRLDWAENVQVSAVGHVGLMFSEAVTNRVIAEIRTGVVLA